MKSINTIFMTALFICIGLTLQVSADSRGPAMKDYDWWRKARFGVFIHWGPSSVVAQGGGSWQRAGNPRDNNASVNSTTPGMLPKVMQHPGWKDKYYGVYGSKIPQEIYDNLYQVFNPTGFNAEEWIDTFKKAGVNYIVFTSKHHDGFCMFDSKVTDYDIMSGPFKRDICKELSDACHKAGIKVIWYYSKPDWYDTRYDPANPKPYEDYMTAQITELATNYGDIKGFWWDGGNRVKINGDRIYKAIYDNQPGAIYNGRGGMNLPGVKFATPEQKLGSFNRGWPWESCVTMQGEGWFWNGGKNVMWPESCISLLINAAVGDGNLLLDFGPTDKGTIYDPIKNNYLAMGKWLKKYGESIYDTRGGPYKPGTWGGATCRNNSIYLHITQTWLKNELHLPALPAKILEAKALTGGKVAFNQSAKELIIKLAEKDHASPDTVIKLTIDKNAEEIEPFESEDCIFVSLNASATASSYIKSWKGHPGSVTLQDFEVNMPKTTYFGEDSEPTAKPESNHKFKPTEEMIKKYPWIKTRRDHIWRYWMAVPSDKTPWLTIDFGKQKEFNKITMLEKYNRIKAYKFEYERDGKWVEFYRGGRLDNISLALPTPIKAQKVRITISDWSGDYKNEGPGLREFDFWYDKNNK